MLIRSQDKDKLINFRASLALCIIPPLEDGNTYPKYSITLPFNPDDSLVLGYYSYHEQCIEILDEIEIFYADKNANRRIYPMPPDDGAPKQS